MPIKLNLKTDAAKAEVQQAVFSGVQDVFDLDIKPEAVKRSPVRAPKGSHNPQGIPGGTNRRSIDTEVTQNGSKVSASLFTQSGYGGYLELGTYKMKAWPYLYPAFEMFKNTIPQRIREYLAKLK
jgi:hypothetical protein